jgi:hypothetical protein
MASYDDELLTAARLLLQRPRGLRGRLPGARIRRSISTTYYAIFHFLLSEVGSRVVGTGNALRVRRRALARTIPHTGAKTALEKLRGLNADASIADFFASGTGAQQAPVPRFVREFARVFVDAYAKRQDADYNLNQPFSEADARLLRARVRRAIRGWRAASSAADRDAKSAVCALVLVKGKLRPET